MPVSPIVPSVKPRSGQRRVLLLTSESALEAEVRDALWIRQQEKEPGLFFELTYVDPALFSDFLGVLDLLFLQQLLGLVPATPNIRGNLPSAQDPLHWVSLLFRQPKP